MKRCRVTARAPRRFAQRGCSGWEVPNQKPIGLPVGHIWRGIGHTASRVPAVHSHAHASVQCQGTVCTAAVLVSRIALFCTRACPPPVCCCCPVGGLSPGAARGGRAPQSALPPPPPSVRARRTPTAPSTWSPPRRRRPLANLLNWYASSWPVPSFRDPTRTRLLPRAVLLFDRPLGVPSLRSLWGAVQNRRVYIRTVQNGTIVLQ